MKAVIYEEHGGVEKMHVAEIDDPVCGQDDVVIKVMAASLNGFDPMMLQGSTGLKTPFPMAPCGDFAGEIVEVGANVSNWKMGDRVCPHPFVPGEGMTGETRIGAASEFVRIPAANLLAMPDGITYVQAASLPIAYGTAYRMMVTRGAVSSGEKVLILGAAGGVGTCCIQLAKLAGAEVIAGCSASDKFAKLKEIGADHIIDTSKEDFVAKIHELVGKPRLGVIGRSDQPSSGGVDVIVNYIGGETWRKSLKCLAPFGRMLTCGATIGYDPQTDLRYIWTYEQNIIGSNGWLFEDQVAIMKMTAEGALSPVIHAVRPLEGVAEAIQELIDRKVVGKSIIVPHGIELGNS